MLIRFYLFALLALPFGLQAESIIDEAKSLFNTSLCLQTKTKSMCTYEHLLASSPKVVIAKDETITGQSGMYTLTSPSTNWVKLWPEQKRQEDLLIMDGSGHAFIQADWLANSKADHKSEAKKPLLELMKALDTEPTLLPLDVWPYNTSGTFYELCYQTNKDTVECMYSAAANIPGGMVKLFTLTASEDRLVEDIVYFYASLDIPVNSEGNTPSESE